MSKWKNGWMAEGELKNELDLTNSNFRVRNGEGAWN